MNEDEIKGMLPSIPTAMLVQELNRRRDEWREAERSLGLGVSAPVARTQRARFSGTTMKKAAIDRWAGWKDFSAKNPKATTKDYFKWRRQQKA